MQFRPEFNAFLIIILLDGNPTGGVQHPVATIPPLQCLLQCSFGFVRAIL